MDFKVVAVLAIVVSTGVRQAQGSDSPAPAKEIPEFGRVEKTVTKYLSSRGSDYNPRDLMTRNDGVACFNRIAALGWKVSDRDEILSHMLPQDDFLVETLRSPGGNVLMRKISAIPEGYDRLDRLSRLPRGTRFVRDLAKGPDGYKLIEYMSKSPGGNEMGKMLSEIPQGADFNKPTGRIYSAQQLLAALRQSHSRAMQEVQQAP
jgi:hypothetical protein